MPLTYDVLNDALFFFSDSYFSKCLPRRLNKCLCGWGKVNLGQRASCWTEGRAECVGANCGLSSPTRRFQFPGKVLGLSLSSSVSLSVSQALEQCSSKHSASYGSSFHHPGAEMVVFWLGDKKKVWLTQTPSFFFSLWNLFFNMIILSRHTKGFDDLN